MSAHRVLFLCPVTLLGGEELSVLSLARGLISRGHEIGLATEGGHMLPEFERAGVTVHRMRMNARRPLGIVRAVTELRALLAARPYDILHAQEVFPTVIASLALGLRGRDAGLVYHYRGVRPRMMPFVARVLPRISDFVITNAEANRRAFLARGSDPDRVVTVYNGFEWEPFDEHHDATVVKREWGFGADARVVGVVGRLHPVKGHRYFLRAAAEVRKRLPNVGFVLVGDGPMRQELEVLAGDLGLQDHVRFHGFERNIAKALSGMDVLVLPSTEEAIGRVLVEAHAVGLPAIASRVGGTGEVIEHGVSGFLVPPGDVGALAERMCELLEDPEERARMGSAGKERVRRLFGHDVMLDGTERVYDLVARQALSTRTPSTSSTMR